MTALTLNLDRDLVLVGYWCSLSQRMYDKAARNPSGIRCCGGVYPDHRPTAVYKVRTP